MQPIPDVTSRLLSEYVHYYHLDRTHLSLAKGTPLGRTCSEPSGRILSRERLGGLHHRYDRAAWLRGSILKPAPELDPDTYVGPHGQS